MKGRRCDSTGNVGRFLRQMLCLFVIQSRANNILSKLINLEITRKHTKTLCKPVRHDSAHPDILFSVEAVIYIHLISLLI